MINKTIKIQKATIDDLYKLTLASANAKSKKIYIYEKSDLSRLIGQEKADILRKEFLKNKVKVKQITNLKTFPKFTKNNKFVNTCMSFRYIPEDLFKIRDEILIFDDKVAIYNTTPHIRLLIVKNRDFVRNQIELFDNLWRQGICPSFGFDYKPNHSLYNPIKYKIKQLPSKVYPDKNAVKAYKGFTRKSLKKYIAKIIQNHKKYYKDSNYLISFIWSYQHYKMIDIWSFKVNKVDNYSGPLGNVKVFKDMKICSDLGLASGNTLLVLGYEEKIRRQSKNLENYFDQSSPKLPLEVLNGKSFF